MTEKELKKLSRAELLEILIQQTEKNIQLQTEMAEMKKNYEEKISDYEKRLKDKNIVIEQSGSIAEAALRLSGIFEAAQQAADVYLENIRRTADKGDNTAVHVPRNVIKIASVRQVNSATGAEESAAKK